MSTRNLKKTPTTRKAKPKKQTVEEMVKLPVDDKERDARKKEAYVAFIRWDIMTLAEKKKAKEPLTQDKFAEKWGIAQRTPTDWKARADFQRLRSEMFRKKLAEDVPEVMADMRKRIKKIGKADEVELWLAYSEGWDKKRVVEITPPVQFGENDIRALVSKLPPEKQVKYYETIAKLLAEAIDADDDL